MQFKGELLTLEVYLYAGDEDHALELAGHGADVEFRSVALARAGYDPEFHEGRRLFRILVEEMT